MNKTDKFFGEVFRTNTDQCILWPFATNPRGYGKFTRSGTSYTSHRYVCMEVHGEAPTKFHHAAHSCGTKLCVNPRHISWKTPKENEADKLIHDRHIRNERHGQAVLSNEEVRKIRADTRIDAVIAADYGISRLYVAALQCGKACKYVLLEEGNA